MMNCHFDTQLKIIQAKPKRMSSHHVLHDHLLEFEAYSEPNLNNPNEKRLILLFQKRIFAEIAALGLQNWNRLKVSFIKIGQMNSLGLLTLHFEQM